MTDMIEGDGGHLMYKSGIFSRGRMERRPRVDLGVVEEPARSIPIFRDCDVLVVGGGPSGTAAAIAAARSGADVVLLERHNHLGGLSTGGLVIWIDRMTDWTGQQVIRGIANDLLDRLPKDAVAGPPRGVWGSADEATAAYWKERTASYHGIVTWSPTVDPEHLKLVSQELVLEHKVQLIFHAWGAMPLMRDGLGCGRHLREQGGPAGDPSSGDDRLHRRRRYFPSRRGGELFRCRYAGYPSLHQHRLPVRRRRHAALDRLQDGHAGGVRCVHGTRVARRAAGCSSGRSCPGATRWRCSWGLGWRVTRRWTWRT